MCTPRLRIIANSRSCSGWSSRKKVFHTDEKCRTSTGAPTSAQNALSSSAIAVTRPLRRSCICPPCALTCLSTALAAARQRMADERAGEIGHAYGWHRIVAKLPVAAVERIHVFALALDPSDWIAPTNTFSVEHGRAACRDRGIHTV